MRSKIVSSILVVLLLSVGDGWCIGNLPPKVSTEPQKISLIVIVILSISAVLLIMRAIINWIWEEGKK